VPAAAGAAWPAYARVPHSISANAATVSRLRAIMGDTRLLRDVSQNCEHDEIHDAGNGQRRVKGTVSSGVRTPIEERDDDEEDADEHDDDKRDEDDEEDDTVVDLREAEQEVVQPLNPPHSRWSEWRAT